MDANPTLTCTAIFEWLNTKGSVLRKVTHKSCTLRIIRNEHRAMFVEATAGKSQPFKLSVNDIQIHNKFMNEGKATVKFKKENCTMLLSNAPPASLTKFLQTMVIKYAADPKSSKDVSLRKQLLSNKPMQYDEISPVTNAELEKVRAKAAGRTTDTTPSPSTRKRKATEERAGGVKGPIAKKLYAASPSFEEEMNIEQKEVLEACLAGNNVFFTGSAGTGKSFLLRKIIAALPPDGTVATASTGVAACHIGGTTLHQFAGIGNGDATLETCYNMASKPLRAQIWRRCKHLIIDEISMIDGKYFEKIEAVARRIRNSEKPFGGIQLILCGDFFQLPPVFKSQSNKEQTGKFCFQTKAWDQCVNRVFELRQVHRQKDKQFIDLLNKIRIGEISDEISQTLTATSKQKIETDGILATRLCSHTQDANIINESKLNALKSEQMIFVAEDSSTAHTKDLDAQTPVPGKLILKAGAQVMLLKNISISKGLVNGARGVVKRFENGVPVVKFRNVEYVAKQERWTIKTADGNTITRKQIPLRLAWAFSIHKSQGLTLDCVEMSLAKVFEAGQAYVALSRAQSLETLRVLDFQASQVWANPDVLQFYRRIRRRIEEMEMMVPMVPIGAKVKQANAERVKKVKLLSKLMASKPIVTIS